MFSAARARDLPVRATFAAASSAAIMDPHPAAAAAAARRRLGALTAHVVIAEAVSAASARAAVLGLAGRLVTRVGLSLERAAERAADAAADATDPDAVAPAGAAAASHSEPVATGVSAEGSVRVDLESLARFCAAAYERAGMPADAAASFGTTIAQTEAWRQSTHGIQQLFDGLNTLEGGIFKADAVPEIRRQSAGTAVIDGQRCMGQVAMELAKQVARKKAKQFGVAMVHVFNTGWLGALGNPLVELASEGLLAQAWCRSPTSADGKPPLDAAPFGGRESRLGTSPMAIAFPSGTQAESGASSVVVSDFSTAVMARSKANAMAAAGEMTSEPMFLEADGTPTCDPLSLVERGGTPMLMGGSAGGFRGFSLSLWTEALALLNGNPFISGSENVPEEEKGPMHELGLQSFTLLVIDAAAFTDDPGGYMREVGSMLSWVQSSATLPGVDRIRIPGDRGAAALDECRRDGVPLDAQKWDSIVSLSQTAGLELPVTL